MTELAEDIDGDALLPEEQTLTGHDAAILQADTTAVVAGRRPGAAVARIAPRKSSAPPNINEAGNSSAAPDEKEAYRGDVEALVKDGAWLKAALLCEGHGANREAAEYFARALETPTCWVERLGPSEICRRAAVLYAALEDTDSAVRVLIKGGQVSFAGRLLAQAGRVHEALSLLVNLGDTETASELRPSTEAPEPSGAAPVRRHRPPSVSGLELDRGDASIPEDEALDAGAERDDTWRPHLPKADGTDPRVDTMSDFDFEVARLDALAHAAPPSPDALTGWTLRNRFRVERALGRGGQAIVYLARDEVLDRPVALKVLLPFPSSAAEERKRFLQEARHAAKVRHPACIAVYDFGEEHGITFMAMEYFEGETLHQRFLRGPLRVLEALQITQKLAQALGSVHEAGIVHRDIKPENVMVGTDGQIRLADFGIAHHLMDAPEAHVIVGTSKYMAPEQARGDAVDARTDLFSLGAILFELLAGRAPFSSGVENLMRRLSAAPPELPKDVPVPRLVRDMLARLMAPMAEHRYRNADQLLVHLNMALSLARAQPDALGGVPQEPARESPTESALRRPAATENLRAPAMLQPAWGE